MTTATLTQDVDTRHGCYPSGTVVRVLGAHPTRRRANVCLDPAGVHLTRRCHVVTIPHHWLAEVTDLPPERATVADERELLIEARPNFRNVPVRTIA